MTVKIQWWFDFISPFAYLQQQTLLQKLPPNVELTYKPVLLAGMLHHWGNRGPAETPSKRIFTYKHTLWMARKASVSMIFPPGHPFNPLKALRLAIALGNSASAIDAIFKYIWAQGKSLDDPAFATLASSLGVKDPSEIATPQVKDALRQAGQEAVNSGVFGVPTFVVDDQLFWGYDAGDMLLEYLQNPQSFQDAEMKRAETLPIAASRV